MMKICRRFLPLLTVLLLAGCSLAQPAVSAPQGDPWVGLYVCPSTRTESFFDNPNLEEHGVFAADTDRFGTLSFPCEVLFGVEDEAGNIFFPGLEGGYSLFYTKQEKSYGAVTVLHSNMAPSDEPHSVTATDTGSYIALAGAVYYDLPDGDNVIWHMYDVYQTDDGRVYLTGDGDSANGPITCTKKKTATHAENGEAVEEQSLSVTVEIQRAARLQCLLVTQFDAENRPLRTEEISLQTTYPHLRCAPEAAWVLVEEISAGGTKRTAYSVPADNEEPLTHAYILLDDDGFGQPASLAIESP